MCRTDFQSGPRFDDGLEIRPTFDDGLEIRPTNHPAWTEPGEEIPLASAVVGRSKGRMAKLPDTPHRAAQCPDHRQPSIARRPGRANQVGHQPGGQPDQLPDDVSRVAEVFPLEQQGGFKQIRLDLPRDLNSAFTIEKYGIVPLDDLPEGTRLIDSYFRLPASAAGNPAIIIPYVTKTLRHGIVRMTGDPVFLIFWLLMIVGLLAAHRFLLRTQKQ